MKKPTLLATLSVVIIGVSALLAKSETEGPKSNLNGPTIGDLDERLTQIEQKVSMLENENFGLKKAMRELQSVTITPKEGWSKREFNGETYYTIRASGGNN